MSLSFETGENDATDAEDNPVYKENNDFKAGAYDGLLVRLQKDFGQVQVSGAYLSKGNDENTKEEESRFSLGVVWSQGDWTVYGDGHFLGEDSNNLEYPNSDMVFAAGIARKLQLGDIANSTLIGQMTIVGDEKTELVAEYQVNLNKSIIVSPGVRHTSFEDVPTEDGTSTMEKESETDWMLNMTFKWVSGFDPSSSLLKSKN